MSTKQQGFTLLELMISVAVVGIVAAVAIPSYIDYIKRARFSEVVRATAPYKLSVTECIQKQGTRVGCNASTNGIPQALGSVGNIASVTVSNGIITATASTSNGLNGETYRLRPDDSVPGTITWAASGTAVTSGLTSQ